MKLHNYFAGMFHPMPNVSSPLAHSSSSFSFQSGAISGNSQSFQALFLNNINNTDD
jgi:hypothetical protein